MILDIPNDSIHIEFKQTFPNTAGIFENGGMSGQAFTTQDISAMLLCGFLISNKKRVDEWNV